MPSLKELENWMTTGDTASALGKTVEGVKWILRDGRLRGVRTRLGWLVDPKDVQRYAREHGIEIKED